MAATDWRLSITLTETIKVLIDDLEDKINKSEYGSFGVTWQNKKVEIWKITETGKPKNK